MNIASASPVPTTPHLWPSVWRLLKLRLIILVSGFRRASTRRKIGMTVLVIIIIGGMVFAFVLSWLLLRFLQSPEVSQYIGGNQAFLVNIPVLVVSAAFIVILLTSFGVLLQALYLAGDMDFLLSVPIPIRAIFISKLLQAIIPNFGLILLFGLPVLYGLGLSSGYTFLYYPVVLIVLALLALAAAGLSSLLVMLVVRIVPARRVAEVLGFFAAIFSLICSQSGQFVNYGNVSGTQATQALGMATRLNSPYSPLAWAGRGLAYLGGGDWLIGSGLVLFTILVCSGIFAVSLVTAERLYYSGWASVQVSARRKRSSRPRQRTTFSFAPFNSLVSRLLPGAVRGIMAKDFLMLRRDLRNMSQLVTPLIFGILYAFLLLRRGGSEITGGPGEAPVYVVNLLNNVLVYANVGISLFVGWSLLSRLAAMGFSQEGKQYWLLKSAPVDANKLITAKYLVAYLPTVVLGLGFLVAISLLQQTNFGIFIFSTSVVVLTMAGLAALGLTFGIVGANFDWEDPRRISQGGVGCVSVIASMAFLVISLALFFGPALLLGAFNFSQVLGQWIGLFLGGAFCLAAGFIPLMSVRGRVPRLNEQ
jgi:ABC-2 type transport system permease protein